MRVKDLLSLSSINLNATATSKADAIHQLVELMAKRGNITDKDAYEKGVLAREAEGSTGIGEGIAIPHCKGDCVSAPGLAAMMVPAGVDYDALDGQPANLFFLIAAPNTQDNVHLEVLSRLSMMLMDPQFQDDLRAAKTPEAFLAVIDAAEAAKEAVEGTNASSTGYDVVAVTACPTGIAHTYMAAEALAKAGEKLGIKIKVETRGSSGAKNLLTDEDISGAKGVIVACDTKVPMSRFAGKKLIEVKVADGINKAEELIGKALKGDAPVYVPSESAADNAKDNESTGSLAHAIYTHLMSGVSHMLPFVIGGGILVALAFLMDTLMGYGDIGASFGSATPISAFLKYVGGLAMGAIVPILGAYIAYSIADRPGLAVGFLGGLLASNGNALASSFNWGELGGLSSFIAKFAFVADNGGNTVSGFLGGIVAGFLAGYTILFLKKITSKLPQSLDGIKPILIYPLGGMFIVGVIMTFILNPVIGVVNSGLSNMLVSLSNSGMMWLLGLIVAGMMAIDMGGPINKAAYVFGTGMLATAAEYVAAGATQTDPRVQACYVAMAAVMIGGMVPPMGIALACYFFPRKFTPAERETKVTNIVMGCSFITEGAIPFAASDPTHVIPCTFVGAAVSGLLSAFFGCTLMSPHGGVFVFATVGRPLMYILAWVIGSIITCLMLGFVKKDAE